MTESMSQLHYLDLILELHITTMISLVMAENPLQHRIQYCNLYFKHVPDAEIISILSYHKI